MAKADFTIYIKIAVRKIDISLGVKPQPPNYCDLQVMSCLCSLRVSHLSWDRHTTTSDPNAVFSLSSHQEHIESRRESADLMPVFKRDAELSLHVHSLQMEPWSPSLTLPLPPPVVGAFEAKWGVNKSNIRCIVRHPKGPNEVTLEVQITLGHSLLAFSCSISPRLTLPTQRMLPNHPPLPSYGLFIFGRLRLIEWGPFWDSTSTGLLSVQSKDHRAAAVTQNGVAASRVLSYITKVLKLLCLQSWLFSVFRLHFRSCCLAPLYD